MRLRHLEVPQQHDTILHLHLQTIIYYRYQHFRYLRNSSTGKKILFEYFLSLFRRIQTDWVQDKTTEMSIENIGSHSFSYRNIVQNIR